MIAIVSPKRLKGTVKAIPSKAVAHRVLICSALCDREITVKCARVSEDIEATVNCLNSLGASIERTQDGYLVKPIVKPPKSAVLDCGESGTTLRFMLPVAAALGVKANFIRRGRLPKRPIGELVAELVRMGVEVSENADELSINGKLCSGEYKLRGDISSQYISGLLLAMPLLNGGGRIIVEGELESRPYVELTQSVQRDFGIYYKLDRVIEIPDLRYSAVKSTVTVEGDWSNAAFWLAAGALGADIKVTGLNMSSAQGDKQIIEILDRMGTNIDISDSGICVSPYRLRSTNIDGTDIPDLIPLLAVLAATADGETLIHSAGRLRFKESDRLFSTTMLLSDLGADILQMEDCLIIRGVESLKGGSINSYADHRIAMSAAIASLSSKADIIIEQAEAVSKSYPQFFEDLRGIGGGIILSGGS